MIAFICVPDSMTQYEKEKNHLINKFKIIIKIMLSVGRSYRKQLPSFYNNAIAPPLAGVEKPSIRTQIFTITSWNILST